MAKKTNWRRSKTTAIPLIRALHTQSIKQDSAYRKLWIRVSLISTYKCHPNTGVSTISPDKFFLPWQRAKTFGIASSSGFAIDFRSHALLCSITPGQMKRVLSACAYSYPFDRKRRHWTHGLHTQIYPPTRSAGNKYIFSQGRMHIHCAHSHMPAHANNAHNAFGTPLY